MKYWFTDPDADLSLSGGQASLADKIKLVKDRMKVDAGSINVEDVVSIPDVWSIHRIYEMLLLYSIGPNDEVSQKYKEAVLRHWHAILAIHFLGTTKYGLNMGCEQISAQTIKNMPSAPAALAQTKAILRSLWDARPMTQISSSPSLNPDSVNVYYVEDKSGNRLPYAMSSATTFLVPTADSWDNLRAVCGKIKWIIPIKDTKKDTRPNDQKKNTVHYSATDPSSINGALTLVERMSLVSKLNGIVAQLQAANSNDPAAVQTLQNLLIDYATAIQTPPTEDDIFITPTVEAERDAGKMYYVQFKDCKSAADASDPHIGGADPRCVYSVVEKGIRTNYLISMPISEQAVGWVLNGSGKYTVTKTPIAGKIEFTIDYIYNNQSFKKIFSEDNANLEEIDQADLSIAAIWPRFQMEHWNRYFVFRHEARGRRVGDQTTYALIAENKPARENVFPVEDEGKVYYAEHAVWPRRWVLRKSDRQGNQTDVGYILSEPVKAMQQIPGKCYHAAIDFGTSATMIYGAVNEYAARPIESENLWSLPLFVPKGDRAAELLRFFIPTTNAEFSVSPLQSILAIESSNQAPMLIGNWIYFQKAAKMYSKKDMYNRFTVHSNLKWDSIRGLLFTTSYLRMISYFVALEARANGCTEVATTISYPTAMTGSKAYIKNIDSQMKDACESVALEFLKNNAEKEPQWNSEITTESRAVAQHIRKQMSATQFCSIDIGGGTSDIFLFKNDGDRFNLKWDGYESSLLCGARAILLESFVTDHACLDALIHLEKSDAVMDALSYFVPQVTDWAKDTDAEKIRRNIEFLLSVRFTDSAGGEYSAGEQLCARAVSQAGLANTSVARLRKRVAYKVAAILYYAGMMTRKTGTRIEDLHILFAGNGSKTLNWISDDDKKTKRFLSAMFNAGAGIDQPNDAAAQKFENIHFASDPKHEVASGAMMKTIDMQNHIDEILAGEKVHLLDENKKVCGEWPVDRNIALEVLNSSNHYITDNDELKAFVAAFRKAMMGILLIPLNADQFNPATADNRGIRLDIDEIIAKMAKGEIPDKKSFFMIGVDALAKQYFSDPEVLR